MGEEVKYCDNYWIVSAAQRALNRGENPAHALRIPAATGRGRHTY